MKIVILNGELQTGMQMYLALSTHFNVQVVQDTNDLLDILDSENTDFTFFDFCDEDGNCTDQKAFDIIDQIAYKHPATQIIGLYKQPDKTILQKAAEHGIKKMITKPVKNRELFRTIDAQLV